MAYSHETYTYDSGSNPNACFTIPFGYITQTDLTVYINDVLSATTDWELYDASTLEFTGTIIDTDEIKILRVTDLTTRAVDWTSGSLVTEQDLDQSDKQFFYTLQEIIEGRIVV